MYGIFIQSQLSPKKIKIKNLKIDNTFLIILKKTLTSLWYWVLR